MAKPTWRILSGGKPFPTTEEYKHKVYTQQLLSHIQDSINLLREIING